MSSLDQHTHVYLAAAEAFVAFADDVPTSSYDNTALGDWTVRDLLGHTGRAMRTVIDYLPKIAGGVDLLSPSAYYREAERLIKPADVHARGVEEGEALRDGTASLHTLLKQATVALESVGDDDPVIVTRAGGMRLSSYLVTRIVELTVHTLDLSAATGVPAHLPPDAMRVTAAALTDLAMTNGTVDQVVLALSGRQSLPVGFTVL